MEDDRYEKKPNRRLQEAIRQGSRNSQRQQALIWFVERALKLQVKATIGSVSPPK